MKLQIGKHYRLANGQEVEIHGRYDDAGDFYTNDPVDDENSRNSHLNIVSEVTP